MERIVNAAGVEGSAGTSRQLDLPSYPYPALLWHSMQTRNGASLGGILLARDCDWSEADRDVISRVSDTCAHALSALLQSSVGSGLTHGLRGRHAKLLAAAGVIGLLAMLIPVPMSVIAPLEVVAQKPFVVAAPIDGVIEEVLVDPGDRVVKNQPLIRMGGMELRNKLEVATQQLQVADARLKKATQMAFSNDEGRNELRLAMADLNLKRAEMNYAEEMFGQSVIRAERDGVAVLSDKQALYGKPVATGERIMQIADPAKVEIAIQLPVKDALVLRKGRARQGLSGFRSVNSRSGRIVTSDYQALPINGDQLAFRVVARLDDATLTPRGSACAARPVSTETAPHSGSFSSAVPSVSYGNGWPMISHLDEHERDRLFALSLRSDLEMRPAMPTSTARTAGSCMTRFSIASSGSTRPRITCSRSGLNRALWQQPLSPIATRRGRLLAKTR